MREIKIIGKNGYLARNFKLLSKIQNYNLNFISTSQINEIESRINTGTQLNLTDILWLGFGTNFYKFDDGKIELKNFNKILTSKNCSSSRIILISSGGTVYSGKNYPYKETDSLKGRNAYGEHKILLEKMLINSGMNYVILRLGNVYGGITSEQINHGVINKWVNNLNKNESIQLTSSTDSFQDYIYIKDLMEALDKIILSNISKSIFNLSFGKPVTLKTILEILFETYGTFNLIDMSRQIHNNYLLDTRSINRAINWKPRYNIKLGMEEFISTEENCQGC